MKRFTSQAALRFLAVELSLLVASAASASLSPAVIRLFTDSQEAQETGKLDVAIAGYRKVLASAPEFGGAHFNLGLALEQTARPAEALHEFLLARKLEPDIPGLDLFIGIESYSTHDYTGAESALNTSVKSMPGDAQAWLWLGKTQAALGKLPDATRALERARTLQPKDASILYNLGQAYARLSQQTYEALYAADSKSYLIDLILAQSYTAKKNYPQAIVKYRSIQEKEPALPGIHEAVAAIHFAQGDLQEAQQEFQQELRIDPNNTAALTGLGMILDRQQSPQEASEYLRRSLKVDRNSALAHLYLGRSLLHLGSVEQAVPELKEAARLDPLDAAVHYQLYQAYTKLKQSEAAAVELRSFKQLDHAAKDLEQQRAEELRNREKLRQRNPDSASEIELPAKAARSTGDTP